MPRQLTDKRSRPLSPAEVGRLLGVSGRTVSRWCQGGTLAATRLPAGAAAASLGRGGWWQIQLADVRAMARRQGRKDWLDRIKGETGNSRSPGSLQGKRRTRIKRKIDALPDAALPAAERCIDDATGGKR